MQNVVNSRCARQPAQFAPCTHATWSSSANLNVVLTIHSCAYEWISADNTQIILGSVPNSHRMCCDARILSAEGRCPSPLISFVIHEWMVCLIVTFDISVEHYAGPVVLIWCRWTTPRNEPPPTGVSTFPVFLYQSKQQTIIFNKNKHPDFLYHKQETALRFVTRRENCIHWTF
jgi:hypothetical protein